MNLLSRLSSKSTAALCAALKSSCLLSPLFCILLPTLSASPLISVSDNATAPTFLLNAGNSTYVIKITPQQIPVQLYWGPAINTGSSSVPNLDFLFRTRYRALSAPVFGEANSFSLDTLPLEYPSHGSGDFRPPAIEVLQPATGSRILDLRYKTHRIQPGKPALPGLPSTRINSDSDASTLTLVLEDSLTKLQVELHYTAFKNHPVIARSSTLINNGSSTLSIERALSASIDLPSGTSSHQFLQLHGAWGRETLLATTPLRPGIQAVESSRGASSHHHNPFFALAQNGADEDHGDVYAFNLIYSGSWLGQTYLDSTEQTRSQIGINPFDFSWQLLPGESFQTPEAVLCFTPDGLNSTSQVLHDFYYRHLLPPAWRDQLRPVVLNTWEAFHFTFTEQQLMQFADTANTLGIEAVVLDDGWFSNRNDDKTSLGDWTVSSQKFPNGLRPLIEHIHSLGMKFGIWLEPEMISPDSDLFRQHPDWAIQVPNRPLTTTRSQLVLDLANPAVAENIYQQISKLLTENPIDYVKWDMNRNITEAGTPTLPPDRQLETSHRYILALYKLIGRLTAEHPDILFENCASGGGRFDPGMMYYFPHTWTSDNTDAIARLRIQYGTSIPYPQQTMIAHATVSPNKQTSRTSPFKTRHIVATTASTGYELDPAKLTPDELKQVKAHVANFKKLRPLLHNGSFYRLRSPFTTNEAAWMSVSPDKTEALVTHVTILTQTRPPLRTLPLRGLDPAKLYQDQSNKKLIYPGAVLLHSGLPLPDPKGDFTAHQFHLKSLPDNPPPPNK